MAGTPYIEPLTGHAEFDSRMSATRTSPKSCVPESGINSAPPLISDIASFSSTSRTLGVCYFLKLIQRARHITRPVIKANSGILLKFDADNCYAYFESADAAIKASFEVSAALFKSNDTFGLEEQIYLSVGIDYGRILLVGDVDFYGDPVNTASKLGEDLAIRDETLVTERAIEHSDFVVPELAERMRARISEIEIKYVRLPMTEVVAT